MYPDTLIIVSAETNTHFHIVEYKIIKQGEELFIKDNETQKKNWGKVQNMKTFLKALKYQ